MLKTIDLYSCISEKYKVQRKPKNRSHLAWSADIHINHTMATIYVNKREVLEIPRSSYAYTSKMVSEQTGLSEHEFYFEQNGKPISSYSKEISGTVQCILRLVGGKGGFGSMLRAIGAQIEKTTNREACRDLSGRRLRDINEEKRLKAWLDKQSDREREAEERKKRKIEKLLTIPKHEFKDEQYEEARAKLTEKVNDAVEQGFKKDAIEKPGKDKQLKRKCETSEAVKAKKKRSLWLDDGLSGSDTSDSESSNSSGHADMSKPKAEAVPQNSSTENK